MVTSLRCEGCRKPIQVARGAAKILAISSLLLTTIKRR
ncbi:hypothetical protein H6F76_04335 [Leptolyngbya sp. FACHB-321]|nr:hypothetical protein [Leptolyngbya sp. FACHB-321]